MHYVNSGRGSACEQAQQMRGRFLFICIYARSGFCCTPCGVCAVPPTAVGVPAKPGMDFSEKVFSTLALLGRLPSLPVPFSGAPSVISLPVAVLICLHAPCAPFVVRAYLQNTNTTLCRDGRHRTNFRETFCIQRSRCRTDKCCKFRAQSSHQKHLFRCSTMSVPSSC